MSSLWKFGGQKPLPFIKLVLEKVRRDELSTRSASLSYYFLLAIFPLFLFLVSVIGVFTSPASQLQGTIVSSLSRLAPGTASEVIRKVIHETFKSAGGIKLAAGILGALWAASGGMSAVVVSMNKIYQAKEARPWWKQKAMVVGLTIAFSALMILALVLALYGGEFGQSLFSHLGAGDIFRMAWKVLEWPVSVAAMFLSFSLIYYFAPDVKERKWFWVTPGSVAGVVLWLAASLGFRFYLHFFNSYSATYGSLGAVVILMLWLYITGFAILIGGEVNWVIENQDRKSTSSEKRPRNTEPRQAEPGTNAA